MFQHILKNVRRDLQNHALEATQKAHGRWFKERILCYGVKIPEVRKIARQHCKDLKHLSKQEVFHLVDDLFKSGYQEEAVVGVVWVCRFTKDFEKTDFEQFEHWVKKYVDNWAKVDDFCLHIMQPLIAMYPELLPKVKKWAQSKNMWVRRAAAVSCITTKQGCYATKHDLKDIFDIAEILLYDSEDLVQKGYGWMLKAASVSHPDEVFQFVMKYKETMPRTALRYAIEKMPEAMRRKAMG